MEIQAKKCVFAVFFKYFTWSRIYCLFLHNEHHNSNSVFTSSSSDKTMEQGLHWKLLYLKTFYIDPRLAQAQGRIHQYFSKFSRCLASAAIIFRLASTTLILFSLVIIRRVYETMFTIESIISEDLVHRAKAGTSTRTH
jgi:hypothetical protein